MGLPTPPSGSVRGSSHLVIRSTVSETLITRKNEAPSSELEHTQGTVSRARIDCSVLCHSCCWVVFGSVSAALSSLATESGNSCGGGDPGRCVQSGNPTVFRTRALSPGVHDEGPACLRLLPGARTGTPALALYQKVSFSASDVAYSTEAAVTALGGLTHVKTQASTGPPPWSQVTPPQDWHHLTVLFWWDLSKCSTFLRLLLHIQFFSVIHPRRRDSLFTAPHM